MTITGTDMPLGGTFPGIHVADDDEEEDDDDESMGVDGSRKRKKGKGKGKGRGSQDNGRVQAKEQQEQEALDKIGEALKNIESTREEKKRQQAAQDQVQERTLQVLSQMIGFLSGGEQTGMASSSAMTFPAAAASTAPDNASTNAQVINQIKTIQGLHADGVLEIPEAQDEVAQAVQGLEKCGGPERLQTLRALADVKAQGLLSLEHLNAAKAILKCD